MKNKKIIYIVSAVVLLLLVGVGSFFGGRLAGKSAALKASESTEIEETSVTTTESHETTVRESDEVLPETEFLPDEEEIESSYEEYPQAVTMYGASNSVCYYSGLGLDASIGGFVEVNSEYAVVGETPTRYFIEVDGVVFNVSKSALSDELIDESSININDTPGTDSDNVCIGNTYVFLENTENGTLHRYPNGCRSTENAINLRTVRLSYSGACTHHFCLNCYPNGFNIPTPTPEETQPVETQPANTQPANTQPAETQPANTQPVETQPAPPAPQSGPTTWDYNGISVGTYNVAGYGTVYGYFVGTGGQIDSVNALRAEVGSGALGQGDQSVANTRAIEAAVYFSHTRPTGEDCFSLGMWGENITSNTGDPISQYYGSDGHRGNMLNPDFHSMATASFVALQWDQANGCWTEYYMPDHPGVRARANVQCFWY